MKPKLKFCSNCGINILIAFRVPFGTGIYCKPCLIELFGDKNDVVLDFYEILGGVNNGKAKK